METPDKDDLSAHLAALSMSTMYLLNAFMMVLQEDGVASTEQIKRSVANAKQRLELLKQPIAIRAAVMLEGMPGGS